MCCLIMAIARTRRGAKDDYVTMVEWWAGGKIVETVEYQLYNHFFHHKPRMKTRIEAETPKWEGSA
jgi:hypothetical protein